MFGTRQPGCDRTADSPPHITAGQWCAHHDEERADTLHAIDREARREYDARVTAGPLAGLIVKVIDDRTDFNVVTFDNAAGEPVRRNVPKWSLTPVAKATESELRAIWGDR